MRKLPLLLFFTIASFSSSVFAGQVIRIASGGITGGYYAVSLQLCNFIQMSNKNVKCEVIPTAGTIDNLNLLRDGKIELALAQANIALEAYNATGTFVGHKPRRELRQLLNLYDEVFTIIAKDSLNVKSFADIEGKRVSNGHPGSGSTITYNELRKLYNFAKEPRDVELTTEEYFDHLCNGELDVVLIMVGHPNVLTSIITHDCEVDFAKVEEDKIQQLIKANPAFHKTTLHKGIYPGITEDKDTIAVPAILITSEKMDKVILNNFMQFFDKNTEKFINSYPTLYNQNRERFTQDFVLPRY